MRGGGHVCLPARADQRCVGAWPCVQVLEVEHPVSGKRMKLTMSHFWPVRKPRPVAEKLAGEEALITGQRVIDVLYPYAPGPPCTCR